MARRRRNPEIIAGRVSSDGSIMAATGDFTVARTSVGTYVVTFPAGFRLIDLNPHYIGGGVGYAQVMSNATFTERSVTVGTQNNTAVATDLIWGFVAVGVQQ